MRAPTEKEIRKRPELAGVHCVYESIEMIEYAIAPVQSNPEAILESVAKGISCPLIMQDALGLCVPERNTRVVVDMKPKKKRLDLSAVRKLRASDMKPRRTT